MISERGALPRLAFPFRKRWSFRWRSGNNLRRSRHYWIANTTRRVASVDRYQCGDYLYQDSDFAWPRVLGLFVGETSPLRISVDDARGANGSRDVVQSAVSSDRRYRRKIDRCKNCRKRSGLTTREANPSASTAFRFVLVIGIANLFADMTYEGARSSTGQFLGTLGASAAIVGFTAGFGELLGYVLRSASGFIADKTGKYWIITIRRYCVLNCARHAGSKLFDCFQVVPARKTRLTWTL